MVSINYSSREVCCKIVFYGPGLSGKTTNLQYIHSKVPQTTRGKLISLATEADRTLFFDFLPINIGNINGLQAKFQLYTVPGQVYYNATRKLVLRGVDGLVFVADSQPDKMDENIESLSNLEENLKEYGFDINNIPIVIQYNKRDLPGVMSVEEMQEKLNKRGWSYFEASASIGNGVFGTLKMIIKLVLDKAKNSGSGTSAQSVSAEQTSKQTTPQPQPEAQSPEGPSVEGFTQDVPQSSVTPPREQPIAASYAANSNTQGQTSTATVTNPKTQIEQTDEKNRPFPGSTQGVKINKSAQPGYETSQSEISDQALGKNIIKERESSDNSELNRPLMAPSLKKNNKKKRGFFKRLFGIK